MIDSTPSPSSVLAFVTTIHAGLLVLRLHRTPAPAVWLIALPSLALAAAPWTLSTPAGLAAGLATHLLWFVACEKLIPARDVAGARAETPGAVRQCVPARGAGRADRPASLVTAVPVLAVRDETETIRTFRVGRPPGLSFQAGQFLAVQVQTDGRTQVRCYSISSSPETIGYLEMSVRRQGQVSNLLHATVRPGASLIVRPPGGQFVYPEGEERSLVLIGGGVGITPLMSMLRHATASDPTRAVTLLYSVRTHADIAFRDELALIARLHPQIKIVISLTGETTVDVYRRGRIDEALVRETVADPAGSIFMLCGPLAMIDDTRALLERLDVPAAQIRAEAFEVAVALGASVPGGEAARAGMPARTGGGRLRLSKSGRTVPVLEGQSLLEAAEDAGVDIPSLCRSGVCGTCRTRVVSGRPVCASDAMDPDDRARGYVLPCVTWLDGDCEVEA
ncbi:MAG TPA: iron-sulfur cluster-binding domain-containing protein [Vicinamibacterales bacterium]|jgi:ferredoxin-NADP reductase